MFQFAAALFLLGGACVAVPLILHFMRRKPTVRIPFPSFYFLSALNARARARINDIRKWIILILRCAAILALCAAFALPFIPAIPPRISSARVILVDASMSMQAGDYSEAAVREIQNMDAKTVAIAGVVADAVVWSGDFTDKKAELENFIKSNRRSDAASYYEGAIRQAQSLLKKIKVSGKSITLVSDMHKLPWSAVKLNIPLAPGIEFKVISPAKWKESAGNVWIDDVRTAPGDTAGELKITVSATSGCAGQIPGALKIFIDGKQQSMPVRLEPSGKSVFQLDFKNINPADKLVCGRAELDVQDELKPDNTYYFTFARPRLPEVLISAPDNGKTDFVMTALKPDAASACANIKYFDRQTPLSQFQDADLIILRSGDALQARQLDALKKSVEAGTGLIIAWENSAAMAGILNDFGVTVAKAEKKAGKSETLGNVNFELAPFKKFTESQAGSLYDAVFYKVPLLKFPGSAVIPAEFTDGSPAIGEFPYGRGSVYVLAFTPDRTGADWPARASFLPFWHELVKRFKIKEKTNDMLTASLRPLPLRGLKTIKRLDSSEAPAMRNGDFVPAQSGAYLIESETINRVLCVNHSMEESALCRMPEKFNPAAALTNKNRNPDPEEMENDGNKKNGQELFTVFLLIALLCGCGELLLANRTAL